MESSLAQSSGGGGAELERQDGASGRGATSLVLVVESSFARTAKGFCAKWLESTNLRQLCSSLRLTACTSQFSSRTFVCGLRRKGEKEREGERERRKRRERSERRRERNKVAQLATRSDSGGTTMRKQRCAQARVFSSYFQARQTDSMRVV